MVDRYRDEPTPWRNENRLRRLYVREELSTKEVGDRFGCSRKTIEKWLDRHGVRREEPPWRDERRLKQLRLQKRLSTHEIAERLGCTQATISNWLNEYGIDSHRLTEERPWHDEQTLYRLYREENRDMNEIADELGCSRETIEEWIHHHGLETRSRNPPLPDELRDESYLRERYVEDGWSTYRIARENECSPSTVHRWLRKHGIETRPVGSQNGELHHRWSGGHEPYYGPNWHTQRRKVRERDRDRCRRCGLEETDHRSQYDETLQVHHIIPIRTFEDTTKANRLDNLVTLCQSCHNAVEPTNTTKEING